MMRLMTTALLAAFLLPEAASAQASRLQQELTTAERHRDALIAEADTAIAAKDWDTACAKGTEAAAQAKAIITLANRYFDAVEDEESLEESDFDVMAAQLSQLTAQSNMIDQAREAVCKTAAE